MASCQLLRCPELLAEIFSHLELASNVHGTHATGNDHEQQELRKTLAVAALSCRAFTEHALAALWRRLDTVRPLLSLLLKPKRQYPKTDLIVSSLSTLLRRRLIRRRCWRRILPSSRGSAFGRTRDMFERCTIMTGPAFIPRRGLSLGDGVARSLSYLTLKRFRCFPSVSKTPHL